MNSPIDSILSRLDKVRQGQNGQWMALCPAHKDKTRSLSIRETDEGSVLLHCFAQCSPQEITQSIGVEMSDLFPPRKLSGKEPKQTPRLITAGQALELMVCETSLVAIIANNLANGIKISQVDLERCNKAVGRISWVQSQFMGQSR